MVSHIYKFTSQCHSQTTPSRSGDSLGQEMFSAPMTDKQTRDYDIYYDIHDYDIYIYIHTYNMQGIYIYIYIHIHTYNKKTLVARMTQEKH